MNRPATPSDFGLVQALAPGLAKATYLDQVASQRFFIIESSRQAVGFFKQCILWENLPLLEVIMLVETHRGNGLGTCAVAEWEALLQRQGHKIAAISTQVREPAQHFWRKAGYRDCGVLTLPERGAELFMVKTLTAS